MELSIFLAKVFGLYLVIVGLFVLIRYKVLVQVVHELTSKCSCMFIIAIITLILGILLVVSHNLWVADWRVIITLLSWLIFISGIIRLFFLDSIKSMGKWWLQHRGVLNIIAIVYILLGLFLIYMACF